MKKKSIIIISSVAGIVILLVVAVFVSNHVPAEIYAVDAIDGQGQWGSISGDVSYPSEMLPFMGVCAESVQGGNMFCTYELVYNPDSLSGYGYELSVPPDSYRVFAHAVSEGNERVGYTGTEYQAYYSDFVTCGLDFNCSSHTPIAVEISRNQHLQDIDPTDWYAI
ncbi:MAG: hypothetical protein WC544_01940 [Patescibacteria group bacterium]